MTDAIVAPDPPPDPRKQVFQGRFLAEVVKDAAPPETAPLDVKDWEGMSEVERLDFMVWLLDELGQNTEGLTVQFPRIKYPTSGSSFWELDMGDEKPVPVAVLEGVILTKAECRVYYPPDESGEDEVTEGAIPLCVSADCRVPDDVSQEKQHPTCKGCPKSAWGSGKGGRGQACKKRIRVYQLVRGLKMGKKGMECTGPLEEVPTFLSLPPTALKPFAAYATTMVKGSKALSFYMTRLGLKDAKNWAGKEYSALDPSAGDKLTKEESNKVKAAKELYGEMMRYRGGKELIEDLAQDTPQGRDTSMDFPGTGDEGDEEGIL
jgi:hypothetical protein